MWSDVAIGIVVVCGANLFFASILGFFGFLRYLKHKETVALAENGLLQAVPDQQPISNPRRVRWGIILMALGMALCIGLYPIGWIAMPGELPLNLGPWMLAGLIPFFFGMALLVIHYLPGLQSVVGHGVQRALDSSESHRLPAEDAIPVEKWERQEEVKDINRPTE